ncbi:hypothetical protein GGR56DRAFT_459853 [Xylariaceae sp. FL0804]|nr:hypothetical protein GGR56DRAFT_459853 [Xylariaceae sp. FL0804]
MKAGPTTPPFTTSTLLSFFLSFIHPRSVRAWDAPHNLLALWRTPEYVFSFQNAMVKKGKKGNQSRAASTLGLSPSPPPSPRLLSVGRHSSMEVPKHERTRRATGADWWAGR